jgi:hypothetical protein
LQLCTKQSNRAFHIIGKKKRHCFLSEVILIVHSAIDRIQIWKLLNQNMNIVPNAASKAYHRNFRIKHHHTFSYSFEVHLIQLMQNHVIEHEDNVTCRKTTSSAKKFPLRFGFSLYEHNNDFHETVYVICAHWAKGTGRKAAGVRG